MTTYYFDCGIYLPLLRIGKAGKILNLDGWIVK